MTMASATGTFDYDWQTVPSCAPVLWTLCTQAFSVDISFAETFTYLRFGTTRPREGQLLSESLLNGINMFRLSLYYIIILIIVTTILAVGGCGTTKPSRFYTLTTFAGSDITADVQKEVGMGVIGVGPVRIAQYLDRPQIVTRVGPNRFEIAEFDRWGGTLKDDFTRALAEHLTSVFPGEPIVRSPWGRSTVIEYQIPVDVIRFDGELGQGIELIAQWQILLDSRSQQRVSKRSSISQIANGPGYEDLVAAKSRAVAELAHEIARALKNMKSGTRAK